MFSGHFGFAKELCVPYTNNLLLFRLTSPSVTNTSVYDYSAINVLGVPFRARYARGRLVDGFRGIH